MKFGIVIFPSKKLQDYANSYRKRYDPHYSLIAPHLTLKYPFESSENDIKAIVKKLDEIANDCKPFELNILKVSSFKPVNNVIYFKVELREELEQLRDKLHNEVMKNDSEFAFVPHITIGQQLSDQEHSDIYSQLSMLDFKHTETIDRFHLMYQLDNGSWNVYETFRFGKDS